jgi:hypothetical protein
MEIKKVINLDPDILAGHCVFDTFNQLLKQSSKF